MNTINISIAYKEKGIIHIYSLNDKFILEVNSSISIIKDRHDFAVWLFLPIAMRINANLHIRGIGTQTTINNAKKMSQIWTSWMPGHFNDINISFDTITTINESNYTENYLCFYSGGIDSTYAIGNKYEENKEKMSLLTLHGMDYSVNDNNNFNRLIEKTTPFAEFYGNKRLFIKTNSNAVYKKYKINKKSHHITHIFTLAGCGFLFSGYFKNILIASDSRLDEQFIASPYGSNSATNFLFDDGITSLKSENDNISRSEKMEWIASSSLALRSSTFCSDRKYRPNNCGICSKCTRTKFMFLAATGSIPNIFLDMSVSNNAPILKISTQAANNTFLIDLFFCAKNNNRLDLIPTLEQKMNKIKLLSKFRLLK